MPRETSVFVWGQHRTSLDESNVLAPSDDPNEGTMTDLLPARIECFQDKRVVSLSCGGTHTLAATEDGLVWSWGFGWSGQLGNGNRDAKSEPTVVNQLLLLKALSNNLPAQAEAGGDHSLALTAAGDVYAWGANLYGQLGFGYNSSAGPGGAGKSGVAGVAGESGDLRRRASSRALRDDDLPQELVAIPRLVVSFHERKVVQVATGGAHSLALTADGRVYAWGRGSNGRLGTGAEAHCFEPTRVHGLRDVTAVQCGWSHSLALREGRVFAWGRGTDGRLGIGSEADALVPTAVAGAIEGHFVVRISGGFAHSAALTVTRQVFTWGWGQFGQLGQGNTASRLVATEVKALEKAQVRVVECGSLHTAAVTEQGELYTWGMGDDGQLGHGDTDRRVLPEKVSFFADTHVESVFCGAAHTYAVTAGDVIIPADPELEEDSLQSAELRQQFLHELSTLHAQLEDTILHSESECMEEVVDVDELFPYNFPAVEQLVLSPLDDPFLTEIIERKSSGGEEEGSGQSPDPTLDTDSSLSSGDLAGVELVTVFEDYPNVSAKATGLELCSPASPARWQEDIDLEPFEAVLPAGSLNAEASASPAQAVPKARKRRKSRPQQKEKAASDGSPRLRSKSMSQKFSDVISGRYFRNQRAQQNEEVNQKVASIWLNKILPRFDEIVRNPQTNWQLWRQGIPASVRGIVWKRAMPNTLQLTQNDFARFSAMEGSRHIDVIDVDLPRTFPHLGLFHKGGALYPALHTVLRCYDNLNPTMGYVQGMSYLGAMLVLHMEPFDAFVVFANMLNSPFFAAMYRMDMERMFKHMKLYETLFEILMPAMYKQFQALGISTEHYLIDWFFTLFTKSLPLDICSRIWDCFFVEGQIFLFVTALSIVNVNRAKLANADFETVITLLRLLPRDTNEDELFKAINKVSVPNYLRKFLQHIVDEDSATETQV